MKTIIVTREVSERDKKLGKALTWLSFLCYFAGLFCVCWATRFDSLVSLYIAVLLLASSWVAMANGSLKSMGRKVA